MSHHLVVARALRRFRARPNEPRVLRRKEPFGHKLERDHGKHERERRERECDRAVAHHPPQRALVEPAHGLVTRLESVKNEVVRTVQRLLVEEPGGQHRRERERHEARDEDRHSDRHRELPEEPADDAAHEKQWNEHRRERQRHRENREADLGGTVERGLKRLLPHLHVAHDVLEHHDRVVHDKSNRQCERHQREVVETVVQHVHHRERAHERHGQREARNQRGPRVAQEQEDHQHDERQREDEGDLHIVYRRANPGSAIEENYGLDRYRHLRAQHGEHRLDSVRHFDGVGARLLLNGKRNGSRIVEPARRAIVLHVVLHCSDVLEAHRRTVPIRDDQVTELMRR